MASETRRAGWSRGGRLAADWPLDHPIRCAFEPCPLTRLLERPGGLGRRPESGGPIVSNIWQEAASQSLNLSRRCYWHHMRRRSRILRCGSELLEARIWVIVPPRTYAPTSIKLVQKNTPAARNTARKMLAGSPPAESAMLQDGCSKLVPGSTVGVVPVRRLPKSTKFGQTSPKLDPNRTECDQRWSTSARCRGQH